MRAPVDVDKLRRLMTEFGRATSGEGRVYLTGGATALLYGWRAATVDVDLHLDPEPAGAFEAIAELKESLDLNVELAAPSDFIPELPGWRDRSIHIGRFGQVDFYHYDPYAQALAKIERGHDRDLRDVSAMMDTGLVEPIGLRELFERIEPALLRYPAIDAHAFRAKLEAALA